MRSSVENPAARLGDQRHQLQDLQYVAMEYDYNFVTNDCFSSHRHHHDHIISNYARTTQDAPIQTHIAPPAPVCAGFTLIHASI